MASLDKIGELGDRSARLAQLKLYVQSHPLDAAGWYMLHLEQLEARNRDAADIARSRALALDPQVARRFDASATVEELPGGTPVVKGYRVLRVIHEGPSSVLYEAVDENGDQQRTLRVLRGERLESMREQLERQLVGVRYRGCATALDVVSAQDGRPVQVLTATFHPPLEAKPGKVPVATARAAIAALARSLAPVHKDGLIAGDLRPSTVVGDLRDPTTLAVLGIRRAAGTSFGTLGGDPDRLVWFAPEEGPGAIDARVDVYGLGLLLWHLVTGERPPYLGKRLESALPSTGDAPLDAIIARATRKDPDERFADVSAFAEALTGLSTSTSPDGNRAGDWILHERIGGGSVADVYAATHISDGRRAAVKVFQRRAAFEREARALRAASHQGLVRLIEASSPDVAQPYLVLDKLSGQTLAERLTRGPLDVDTSIDIARDLARALAALHAAGVVHRDVKPNNIMVSEENGRTRVTLFDLDAVWLRDAPGLEDPDLTGTASHMAPEQWQLVRDLDARTDVYALGLVLFECLHGRHPLGGENSFAGWRRAHCEATTPPVPAREGLREHRRALIERMIARDRAKRPASMDEVIVELDREPVPSKRPAFPRWILLALAGLLVAGGIGIGVFALTRGGKAVPADAQRAIDAHVAIDAQAVIEWCETDPDSGAKLRVRLDGGRLHVNAIPANEPRQDSSYTCDPWTGTTTLCQWIDVEKLGVGLRLTARRGLAPSDVNYDPVVVDDICPSNWP